MWFCDVCLGEATKKDDKLDGAISKKKAHNMPVPKCLFLLVPKCLFIMHVPKCLFLLPLPIACAYCLFFACEPGLLAQLRNTLYIY